MDTGLVNQKQKLISFVTFGRKFCFLIINLLFFLHLNAHIGIIILLNYLNSQLSCNSNEIISGTFAKILLVVLIGLLAWGYQATRPPPPKTCGSPDGPPVTAPRIKLSDGRYLAYKEIGVPRENAKYKIVYIHGYDCCRHDVPLVNTLSKVTSLDSFALILLWTYFLYFGHNFWFFAGCH